MSAPQGAGGAASAGTSDALAGGPHLYEDFFSTIEEAGLSDLAQEIGMGRCPDTNGISLSSSSMPMQVRSWHAATRLGPPLEPTSAVAHPVALVLTWVVCRPSLSFHRIRRMQASSVRPRHLGCTCRTAHRAARRCRRDLPTRSLVEVMARPHRAPPFACVRAQPLQALPSPPPRTATPCVLRTWHCPCRVSRRSVPHAPRFISPCPAARRFFEEEARAASPRRQAGRQGSSAFFDEGVREGAAEGADDVQRGG